MWWLNPVSIMGESPCNCPREEGPRADAMPGLWYGYITLVLMLLVSCAPSQHGQPEWTWKKDRLDNETSFKKDFDDLLVRHAQWIAYARINRFAGCDVVDKAYLTHPDRLFVNAAVLDRADLQSRDLRGARLSGASLNAANFSNALLQCADFAESSLEGADFRGANLGASRPEDRNLLAKLTAQEQRAINIVPSP